MKVSSMILWRRGSCLGAFSLPLSNKTGTDPSWNLHLCLVLCFDESVLLHFIHWTALRVTLLQVLVIEIENDFFRDYSRCVTFFIPSFRCLFSFYIFLADTKKRVEFVSLVERTTVLDRKCGVDLPSKLLTVVEQFPPSGFWPIGALLCPQLHWFFILHLFLSIYFLNLLFHFWSFLLLFMLPRPSLPPTFFSLWILEVLQQKKTMWAQHEEKISKSKRKQEERLTNTRCWRDTVDLTWIRLS